MVLPLTSQAETRMLKSRLEQAAQATMLWLVAALIRARKVGQVRSWLELHVSTLQRHSFTQRAEEISTSTYNPRDEYNFLSRRQID